MNEQKRVVVVNPEHVERVRAFLEMMARLRGSAPSALAVQEIPFASIQTRPRAFMRVKGRRSLGLRSRSNRRKASR